MRAAWRAAYMELWPVELEVVNEQGKPLTERLAHTMCRACRIYVAHKCSMDLSTLVREQCYRRVPASCPVLHPRFVQWYPGAASEGSTPFALTPVL